MTPRYYRNHRPWGLKAAEKLLDLSAKDQALCALATEQLESAVALQRMLMQQGIAYLADEVGMGKTYVALATIALFRHRQPNFRVLYLAPSRNVCDKWAKREYPAFIRDNVRNTDARVRGPDGMSPAPAVRCHNVDDWLRSCNSDDEPLDTFMTFTSLSFPLWGDEANWRKRLRELASQSGLTLDLPERLTKCKAKKLAAELIYKRIPTYDLVVVDEAHLLKGGIGSSHRVTFLSQALGTHDESNGERRFRGALLLSATPFDRDLGQLVRQLKVMAPAFRGLSPADAVNKLNEERRAGCEWESIQKGLRQYLIRRVQRLPVGDRRLSRNQYRQEFRAGAGISLKNVDSITPLDAARQRLFTALVQKKLAEHVAGMKGRFPMAMFASWEAYTPPSRQRVAAPVADDEENSDGTTVVDAMDSADEKKGSDAQAVDSDLIRHLVGAYNEKFGKEPPHPKLENEAKRLANEAFVKGHKQLAFVSRLKSVHDLWSRLNEQYDQIMAAYLEQAGLSTASCWLEALRGARGNARPAHGPQVVDAESVSEHGDVELPAHAGNLFAWFFRGALDETGQQLAKALAPLDPHQLRMRMGRPTSWHSLLGELDWVAFVKRQVRGVNPTAERIAAHATSEVPGRGDRLDRYRRVQIAWLELAARETSTDVAQAMTLIADHLRGMLRPIDSSGSALIEPKGVKELLEAPTLAIRLQEAGLEDQFLPDWQAAWVQLTSDSHPTARSEQILQRLDLHREMIFSLLRLDHPFIDLYIAYTLALRSRARTSGDERDTVEAMLCVFLRRLKAADGGLFSTRRIFSELAAGWNQVVKTNFADFIGEGAKVLRKDWRLKINQRLSPFSPVEWASGDNPSARSAIARRFRMPGYPYILVSTSVLQEGEDLHLFCDRVTHYGITGSPIGIEQKNGRVDRIGALAQRRLQRGEPLQDARIQVRFPHLAESLEWYQVRELCHRLNSYLQSMHQFASHRHEEPTLDDLIADSSPIPEQIDAELCSPFDPVIESLPEEIQPEEVLAIIKRAKSEDA